MTPTVLTAILTGAAATVASGQMLLWSDNFDTADTTDFDGAPIAGRLSGPLGTTPDVVARSSKAQQDIAGNQLSTTGGPGRLRFQESASGPWYDWAAGAAAADILTAGGLQVSFDWVPTDDTQGDWVNIVIGHGDNSFGEPGTRVNDMETDYGILFRNNGGTERFDNGFNKGPGGTFPATLTSRHVELNYAFDSFANGSEVRSLIFVDGVQVADDALFWDNNSGKLYFEFECNKPGSLIDNLTVSTVGTYFSSTLDAPDFPSGIASGGMIGTLTGETFAQGAEASTFVLVAGEGDTDNALFQIVGNELQSSGHDFTQYFDGDQFSIRVAGTGTTSGGSSEQVFLVTLLKDDDLDTLPDWFETATAGNLTDLDGLAAGPGPGTGSGDFDGDGLTDLVEFQLSESTYPLIDPTDADSDFDNLSDGDEVNGTAGLRPATDPTLPDTDNDGLDDDVETNTGTYADAGDTGTNPTVADGDGDGLTDGFEADNFSPYDPFVSNATDDFDTDGLDVSQEIANGTDVLMTDTDGDNLSDGDEVNGTAGLRPATNPTLADTDIDGLDDDVETNTGTYADADDTGTNPILQDTDLDGARDSFELDRGSDPLDELVIPALPAGFAVVEITTDASSGINASKTYTHAVSGGSAVTVNGVAFDELSSAVQPLDFIWDTGGFSMDQIGGVNFGEWIPANGGVEEPGLQALLGSFSYSGSGDQPESMQTYALTGLTPGESYDLRLYIRLWGAAGSPRPIDFTFINGAQEEVPFGALNEDRPQLVLGSGTLDTAYYLSFTYTAEGTDLVIEAMIPAGSESPSGSYHMYGLTNEVVGSGGAGLRITNVTSNASGQIVIDFAGAADTSYSVTKSVDLPGGFGPLDTPLSVLTDGTGIGQAIVPAAEASDSTEFYRIEE